MTQASYMPGTSRKPMTCAGKSCANFFLSWSGKRFCSKSCARKARAAYLKTAKPRPICARPGCGRSFDRVTCQRYCTVQCRKADRKCPRCKDSLPTDQPGTKNSYCRPCQAEMARIHRTNPDAHRRALEVHRLKKYGLTPEQYIAMSEAQSHLCAICGKPERAKTNRGDKARTLSVDHCHETGRIRGLLCSSCNRGIGYLNDDPALVQAALDYLTR